jgi:fused signal recognition particle receptor
MDDLLQKLKDLIERISSNSDKPEDIVVVLFIFLSVVALVMAIALIVRNRTIKPLKINDGFDRVAGVLGKIEKIEKNINDFKTEISRSVEKLKEDVDSLKSVNKGAKETLIKEPINYTFDESSTTTASSSSLAGSDLESSGLEDREEAQFVSEESNNLGDIAPPKKKLLSEQNHPLEKRLTKTRVGFFSKLRDLFSIKPSLDPAMLDELEALLVASDLGVRTVQNLIEDIKSDLSLSQELTQDVFVRILKNKILNILEHNTILNLEIVPLPKEDGPLVVMMLGINGAGKTTTSAKLAAKWKDQGAKVLLVAADTFRAAAVEQLIEWGKRLNITVHAGGEDAKPGTVVYDALIKARDEKFDVVIIDTAGRLHTRTNLMQELAGIKNTISKIQTFAPHETLLVLDATIGINAISQAKEFHQATPLTGLVVTKLDGTAKGGIIVAIKQETGVPVRYIGVGEAADDLLLFKPQNFVEALFSTEDLVSSQPSANAEIRRRRRREEELVG